MKSMIINRKNACLGIPDHILSLLPYRISDAVRRKSEELSELPCEEIRLRCGRMSALTVSSGTVIPLEVTPPLTREEMELTVERLSGGSLYAHGDTIKQGYISLKGGVRAGICGRAAYDGGRMIGVNEINGICIRLPHSVRVDASPICELIRESGFSSGVLIYSPPGVGKTTLLRSVAVQISKEGGARVVVVDSRGELEYGLVGPRLCLDVLSGYSKAEGIEIALRTLNASLIVCDEIGGHDDVEAICGAAVGGAALVASAHAADIGSLLMKKNIRVLVEAGVFSAFVGISRAVSGYEYKVTRLGEIAL